jgi:asparagine synthase (glutamine-hydrolysing)
MMQDTLRGSVLKRIPFLNREAVIEMLDRIPTMAAKDKKEAEIPFMNLLSACVMAERFGL